MKVSVVIFCLALFLNLNGQVEKTVDFCTMIREIVVSNKIGNDVRTVSKHHGEIDAVVYYTDLLNEKFNFYQYKYEYNCGQNFRIAIFNDEQIFVEYIRRAIQIDRITSKRKKSLVTYSLIEFSSEKGAFERKTIFTKTIKINL